MAIKELTTRIQLKYDTYANWSNTSKVGEGGNLILKPGEIGICYLPVATAAGFSSSEPAILFKIGDGTHTYTELDWCSGLAADVSSWAKAANKPTYTADEISNLDSYISAMFQDTDTQYRIVEIKSNDLVTGYKLQAKVNGGTFSDIAGMPTIDIKTDAEINALITAALNSNAYLQKQQGVEHAGKFLVIGDDGNITTRAIPVYDGSVS